MVGEDPREHASVEHDRKGGEDDHHHNILTHQADSKQAYGRDKRGNKDWYFASSCGAD